MIGGIYMARRPIEAQGARGRNIKLSDGLYHWITVISASRKEYIGTFIERSLCLLRRCIEEGIDPFDILEKAIEEVRSKKRKKRAASSGS